MEVRQNFMAYDVAELLTSWKWEVERQEKGPGTRYSP
jgi:hypothetical protein